MNKKTDVKNGVVRSAKEVARTAVFLAAVIGVQYAFAALPFVEVVTLLFACYAYVFGGRRGVVAAVLFALLRQLLFGFYPVVLVLYCVHFSCLSLVFGGLKRFCPWKGWRLLVIAVSAAVVCTVAFTLLDNLLTPLWYHYSARAAKAYFVASLPFMLGQSVCAAVTVGGLFVPLTKALFFVKNNHRRKNRRKKVQKRSTKRKKTVII